MTTKESYIQKLSTLVSSGVPIIVTKTREPYRALSAIDDYVGHYNGTVQDQDTNQGGTLLKPYAFGKWTILKGWTVKKPEDYLVNVDIDIEDQDLVKELESDGMLDPVAALTGLLTTEDEEDKKPDGVYALNWLHFAVDNPGVKACLLEMAHEFLFENKKLILVVPQVCEIPQELQDFVCYLDYDVPSDEERITIINAVIKNSYGISEPIQGNMALISSAGAGMTSFEFENSVSRAVKTILKSNEGIPRDRRHEIVSAEEVASMVLQNKTEMVKRSEILEVMPKGSMSDIGGLDNLKEWVAKRKRCFTPEAREAGVDMPKGVALFGPPGTGKSASAKAIGHELDLPVIKFDVSRVFNSFVGASEARVRSALKDLKAMAPVVAFLDEVDKAFDMSRGGGDGGVGQRVLGAILTFMQEEEESVFWVMTGNRVSGLPPELLRKGRLDEVFSVNVPNATERMEILRIHLRKRNVDPDTITDLQVAVNRSNGFVAAELEAAVKEAKVVAFNDGETMSGALIARQFDDMKPLREAFEEAFNEMEVWARHNARPASRDDGTLEATKSPTTKTSTGNTLRKRQRAVEN